MQVSPPKQGSARRVSFALLSASSGAICTTMSTSSRIVVAAMQVSPPKHTSPFSPSLLSSAACIGRGRRTHITTSSFFFVFFCAPPFLLAPFFLLDMGSPPLLGGRR